MIRTITPADMKRVETAVMNSTAINGDMLMQRAADHVAQAVRRMYAGQSGWVLCVCGAVRGVGGIDSWGSDVEEAYHIDAAKDISFSFNIRL